MSRRVSLDIFMEAKILSRTSNFLLRRILDHFLLPISRRGSNRGVASRVVRLTSLPDCALECAFPTIDALRL